MREIIFDTETTGLDPRTGDRVVEIGCVEILNLIPTGQTFHLYINPERDMPDEAFRIHGLSTEFLSTHPCFGDCVDRFLDFIGEDSRLIAHNAGFDFAFINHELERCGRPILLRERIIDTLSLARRRHPGGSNRLDDLCNRYGIDLSRRTKHGALLDAELLAEVYAELMGGRQASLGLAHAGAGFSIGVSRRARQRDVPLVPRLTPEEGAEHAAFVDTLGDNALWRIYEPQPQAAAAE